MMVRQKQIEEVARWCRELNLPMRYVTEIEKQTGAHGVPRMVYYCAYLFSLIKQDPSCRIADLKQLIDTAVNEGTIKSRYPNVHDEARLRRILYHERLRLQKKVRRIYRRIMLNQDSHPHIGQLRPTIYVRRFGEKLKLPHETIQKAEELAGEAVRRRLHLGGNPNVLAAASLYLANLLRPERPTKSEICKVCGTAYEALTIRAYELSKSLGLELSLPSRRPTSRP